MSARQPFGKLPIILLAGGAVLLAIYLLWTYAFTPISAAVQTAWEEHKQEEARQKEEDAKKDVIHHWWGDEPVSHPCTRLGIGEKLAVTIKAGERRDFCEADWNRTLSTSSPQAKDGPGCIRGLSNQTPFRDGVCDGIAIPPQVLPNNRLTIWAVDKDVTMLVCDDTCG